MRERTLPLTALRAFEAAARHMSFKNAAAELGVTPTAVSHQVRALEDACGTALFRRQPRPLALTDAGGRLLPLLRAGFDSLAAAIASVRVEGSQQPLRITTTNAFAHRWLVPRLPQWREARPGINLRIIGTDAVIDLAAGQADVAIRYAREPPPGLVARELLRDRFWPMCSPALLAATGRPTRPADLARLPLIHMDWPPGDPPPPTWQSWADTARRVDADMPEIVEADGLTFQEELHAIEAMVGGLGAGIGSDVLCARELATGALVKTSPINLPGFGFYLCHLPAHPRRAAIEAFAAWAVSEIRQTDPNPPSGPAASAAAMARAPARIPGSSRPSVPDRP
jgi:LysR family glycine cleavage system transcriptional activator